MASVSVSVAASTKSSSTIKKQPEQFTISRDELSTPFSYLRKHPAPVKKK